MKTISHSALSLYNECPFKYHLTYNVKAPRFKSIHTAFGSACHSVLEKFHEDRSNQIDEYDFSTHFQEYFDIQKAEYENSLNDEEKKELEKKSYLTLISEFYKKGPILCQQALIALEKEFPGYSIVLLEHKLEAKLNNPNFSFLGFLDLLIEYNGKKILIDYKTTSWGWDMEKRQDKLTNYQLSLYKFAIMQEFGYSDKEVESYFYLLKKAGFKKVDGELIPKENIVESIRVSNTKRRISNALKLVDDSLNNIENEVFIKNKMKCRRCHFKGTEYCP